MLYISQGKEAVFEDIYGGISEAFDDFEIDVKLHPQEDENSLKSDLIIGKESTIQTKTNIIDIPTIFALEDLDLLMMLTCFKNGEPLPKYKYDDFEKDAANKTLSATNEIIQHVLL